MKLSGVVGFLVCAVLVLSGVVGWMGWSYANLVMQMDYFEGRCRDVDSKLSAATSDLRSVSSTCGQFLTQVHEDREEYKKAIAEIQRITELSALRAMKESATNGASPKASDR